MSRHFSDMPMCAENIWSWWQTGSEQLTSKVMWLTRTGHSGGHGLRQWRLRGACRFPIPSQKFCQALVRMRADVAEFGKLGAWIDVGMFRSVCGPAPSWQDGLAPCRRQTLGDGTILSRLH